MWEVLLQGGVLTPGRAGMCSLTWLPPIPGPARAPGPTRGERALLSVGSQSKLWVSVFSLTRDRFCCGPQLSSLLCIGGGGHLWAACLWVGGVYEYVQPRPVSLKEPSWRKCLVPFRGRPGGSSRCRTSPTEGLPSACVRHQSAGSPLLTRSGGIPGGESGRHQGRKGQEISSGRREGSGKLILSISNRWVAFQVLVASAVRT